MDTPIYLQFMVRVDERVRHRWYVIEERGGEEETAADGLEGWVHKSNTDRVRELHLPRECYDWQFDSLAVADSRLFLIGGSHLPYNPHKLYPFKLDPFQLDPFRLDPVELDPFRFDPVQLDRFQLDRVPVDLYQLPCCLVVDLKLGKVVHCNGCDAKEGAIYRDGWTYNGWTYTVGKKKLRRFRWDDFSTFENLPFNFSDAKVLAFTETEVYLFCPSFEGGGSIVRGDLKSNYWKPLNLNSPCSHWSSGVVLGNNYLVSFGVLERNSRKCLDYLPGIYIYDIHSETWLSQPVQGLKNDGIILPTLGLKEDRESVFHSSLMQVRRDELKLALVWSHEVPGEQTQVHWSKFILHSNNHDGAPAFDAELLSHGVCLGGDTLLLYSTTG